VNIQNWLTAAACAVVIAAAPARAADLSQTATFDIPAQSLDTALVEFSRQSKLQVSAAADQVGGLRSEAVRGTMPVGTALKRLLQGTGLGFREVGTSAISIGRFGADAHAGAARAEAPAPAGGNPLLDEVVVTATKREEPLQRVGITVNALSSDQMRELGVVNSSDLSLYVPGLQLQTSGGEGNTMAMALRGVGQNDFNDHQESPIAIYVDEVYSSSMTATSFLAFDLDRVEVLRGPQGTLFGRNATGGLVQFVTRKPTRDPDGFVSFGYGRFNDVSLEAAYGDALGDRVQGRVSVATHHRDQYFKNLLQPGAGGNGKNDVAARLQLAFQPGSDTDVRLVLRGSDSKNAGPRGTPIPDGYNASGLPYALAPDEDFWGTGPGNNPAGYRYRGHDPWSGAYDQFNPLTQSQWGVSAHVSSQFGPLTVFSITDYSFFKHLYREDSDMGPTRGLEYAATTGIDQASQELRAQYDAARARVIGGLYFLDINGDYRNEWLVRTPFIGISGPPTVLGPDGTGSLVRWNLRTRSYSAFGQVDWTLADTLSLTTGVRWTRDRKRQHMLSDQVPLADGQAVLTPEDPGITSLLDYRFQRSDSFVSWTAGLNWTPTDALLVFASVTRGQKGGGYSVPFFASAPDGLTFRPEQLTSYEAGLKWSGTGLVRRVNLAAYHYDYRDYQAYQIVNAIGAIFNADARTDGVEADLVLTPLDALTVQLGSAFIVHAKVRDVGLPAGIQADRRLPQAPSTTLNASVRYAWPLASGELAAQVDGHYQSGQYFDVFNSPVNFQSGYGLVNLRLFHTSNSGRLVGSAFVENLANRVYRTFSVDTGGMAQGWLGVPRTYGVQLEYRLGK
jgi:iron complex outermembrane receptor protein